MSFIQKIYLFIFIILINKIIYSKTILMHVFQNQNIELNLADSDSFLSFKISTKNVLIEGLEQDQVVLTSGISKSFTNYPICCLKKLNYLSHDDHLNILLYSNQQNNPVKIDLPDGMSDKILNYFLNDISCWHRQCYDFFKKIFFDLYMDKYKSYDYIEMHELDKETDFNVGDGVMICRRQSKIYGVSKKIVHYALALGNNLFISKAGNGNFIVVQDMFSMLNFWHANGFYRVSFSKEPHFPCREISRFLDQPFFEI